MSRLPPILPPPPNNNTIPSSQFPSPKINTATTSFGTTSSPLGSPRTSLNPSHLPGHLSPYRDSATRFSSTHTNTNLAVGSPRSSALARDAASSLQYPTSASRPTSPSPDQSNDLSATEDKGNDGDDDDDDGKAILNKGVPTRSLNKTKRDQEDEAAAANEVLEDDPEVDLQDVSNTMKSE